MDDNTVDLVQEKSRHIEPIPLKLTIISVIIVGLVLTGTIFALTNVPSPDDGGSSFLMFLLRSIKIL